MVDGLRRWRISGAIPFPMRQVVEVPGETPDSLPQKIGFVSRVEPHVRNYGGVSVGLRPWTRDPLPDAFTAGWAPMRECVELAILTEATSADTAQEEVRELVEFVVEQLSFQTQEALQYLFVRILDVTPPVAVGEQREVLTANAFALDKFLRDAPLGTVLTADEAELPEAYARADNKIRQASGWYTKALSTPFPADQYIFLWIAVDLFVGMSGMAVEVPYSGPKCGHEIPECPQCRAPTTKKLQGDSVRRYLTERWAVSADVAKRMWKARQIMHGAVAFESHVMKGLPELVQVLRAVVAAELKLAFGMRQDDFPQVSYGGPSINPDWTGIGGTSRVSEADLDFP